jgi:DNA mismatch repair protein MutS2
MNHPFLAPALAGNQQPFQHVPNPEIPAAQQAIFVPDLLNAVPTVHINLEQTRFAMALAFASGGSGGLFADALARASIAPSTWDPASFANDLFLQNFVAQCLRVRIGGEERLATTSHIVRLLTRPPADLETVHFRRGVLGELAANRELRTQLERLYVLLCRFRALLEGATGIGKWDSNRRQLDLLVLIKDIIESVVRGFVSARSGLNRLAAFGSRIQAGEPYQSLVDLLKYDEKLATLNLKVCVGADGRIRGFDVFAIQENEANQFVIPVWRRWLSKIELFIRGYRFSEGEVMARLIDAVFDGIHDEVVYFVQLLGDVEFYLGAVGFQDLASSAGLEVCLPDLVRPEQSRALLGLFNPLLLAQGCKAVPCNLSTDRQEVTLLVTGPNSGGKTRLLQSVGLTQLLAQNGLFVPARAASIALCPGLVVSLIQETRADQPEGRLGMELMRIRDLFERLPPGAMVILDELCSGTNPSEGEEIFELVVRSLSRLKPQAFITTHFLAFAARLEQERKIQSLRFLQVELGATQEPTYQFVPGVARTSLAGQTAARLGVTGDQLTALVERSILQSKMLAAARRG